MLQEDELAEIALLFEQADKAAQGVERARALMSEYAQQRRSTVAALRAKGVSYGEIARGLGCSRSAVQSLLRDGRTLDVP